MSDPNKNVNYVLTEDQRYDVTKLRTVNPGDEYYIVNEETGDTVKVGREELREFFSKNTEKLSNLISTIVKKNIQDSCDATIANTFKNQIAEYIYDFKNSWNLLNFKGEVPSLPSQSEVGSIYKIGEEFFLYYDTNKYKQIMTLNNVESYLTYFYSKDEIHNMFNDIVSKYEELDARASISITELEPIISRFITKDEFIAKLSKYEQQINQFRDQYEKKLKDTEFNWNTEIEKINRLKDKNNNALDFYKRRYNDLKNKVDSYQSDINEYKNNIEETLSASFGNIDDLKVKLNNYNNHIIALQTELDIYKNNLISLQNRINELTNIINDLKQENQEILNI